MSMNASDAVFTLQQMYSMLDSFPGSWSNLQIVGDADWDQGSDAGSTIVTSPVTGGEGPDGQPTVVIIPQSDYNRFHEAWTTAYAQIRAQSPSYTSSSPINGSVFQAKGVLRNLLAAFGISVGGVAWWVWAGLGVLVVGGAAVLAVRYQKSAPARKRSRRQLVAATYRYSR